MKKFLKWFKALTLVRRVRGLCPDCGAYINPNTGLCVEVEGMRYHELQLQAVQEQYPDDY